MNATERLRLAEDLAQAYLSRRAIDPPSGSLRMSVEDAYAVQRLQVDAWVSEGRRVRGYKVGITGRAAQAALGGDQPDYGHLLDDMVVPAASVLPRSRFLQPRVEPEIAFVLDREIRGPGVGLSDVQRAVDFVLPALEIVDSRIRDWKVSFADTIADNASSGMVVLGSHPVALDRVDLARVECRLYKDGQVVETGSCSAVLGDPTLAIVWLANFLGSSGVALPPGAVVMSGTCTRAVPASPGDRVRAEFVGVGSVTASFGESWD